MQKYVKVLIVQTGSIDDVTVEYYERYKDDGLILIPEDVPTVLADLEAPVVVPQEEPSVGAPLSNPELHKELIGNTKVELPKKPRGRQKRLTI